MPDFRVLVPLDGSRLAENSLVYLQALDSLGELNVLLLSVVDELNDDRLFNSAEARERERNLLSTYLREVSSDLEQHLGIAVEEKVTTGSPANSILKEAHAYETDLLVMSTHGRSGVSRWRYGSVADKVIRGAECNTLVLGPMASDRETWLDAQIAAPFKVILVPLDGSGLAEGAVSVAKSYAESYGSTVHLIRVVSLPTVTDGIGSGFSYGPELIQELLDDAKDYLKVVSSRFTGPEVVTQVLVGAAATELRRYAAAKAVGLVIMTSHGRGGIVRSALGSVTDRMLGGTAPVVVVRPVE